MTDDSSFSSTRGIQGTEREGNASLSLINRIRILGFKHAEGEKSTLPSSGQTYVRA